MAWNEKVINEYLETHLSKYVGKYRFHSGYQSDDKVYKAHYYMFDENFRQIDIYIEVTIGDQIIYTFSEELHEQEKEFIIKDLLERILLSAKYPTTLHYSLYEKYTTTLSNIGILEPIDFYNLLNYMKYHGGINKETMERYYELFMPCLQELINHEKYERYMELVILFLRSVCYEYEWDGANAKYLDTEYQYHLYHLRKIIRQIGRHFDDFMEYAREQVIEAVIIICTQERFALSLFIDMNLRETEFPELLESLLEDLKEMYKKFNEDESRHIAFMYMYYSFYNDQEKLKEIRLEILRNLVLNMLSLANHDIDLALCYAIVKDEGYEIVLDLFHRDYNTFIFTCFPIAQFPEELKPEVRHLLVTAIQFFAARMDNDSYRLSSFEQVININRILMDNFKEWYS